MKTYTRGQVIKMLKSQKKLCATIPLLARSRGRTDWREWNKYLNEMSKAIKELPILIDE